MTREEARTALGDRNNLLWGMSKEEQKYYSEALDMAISALSDSADIEESEWKTDDRGFTYCNACKFTKVKDDGRSYKYCPSCGKPMITTYERG